MQRSLATGHAPPVLLGWQTHNTQIHIGIHIHIHSERRAGDKTLKLWSLQDGACLRTFEGHTASALRATFATAGTQIVSAGADGLVKLWSTRRWAEVQH